MKELFVYINSAGDKYYFEDREMTIRHREDGPAVEWADGYKSWWINGKLHREDGPAVECANGTRFWYINGEPYLTEEQFNARTNPVELTLDEIAAKFNVSVDRIKVKK